MSLVPLPMRPVGLLNHFAAWYSRRNFGGVVADPAKAMVVSQRIGCPWCVDFGWYVFDDRERLVLEYAEAASETPAFKDRFEVPVHA